MSNLDLFLPVLGTTDVRKKILIGDDIITYLSSPDNPPKCEDIGLFIDGLVSWINNSNFKVCQNGLEVLSLLVNRLKEDFRPYIQTILHAVIDRLGDSKDSVREKAEDFILKLMEWSIQPQLLWERLLSAFVHRNNKVREEIHKILIITLNSYGSSSLSLNKLVPSIVKCLSDPTPAVRDAANQTLVEIYRHVGEKVRADLEKRGNVPPAKLNVLFAKFDEVRDAGDMLPTAVLSLDGIAKTTEDEPDRSLLMTGSKRATSAPAVRKLMAPPLSKGVASSVAGPATGGGMDEETFIRAFEEVPKIQIYSSKEMEEHLVSMRTIIQDPNNDWAKRAETLKKIRSLLIAGASNYDELFQHIRLLEPAFQTSVKDLRSQVVREACVSIAYMSQQLQNKLDHFAEALLNPLILLIPNSAKIMATAGTVCVRFIIAHTHSARLIPILTNHMTSKSKDIRRAMCEFLDQLLHTWPTHILEKHVALIQSAVSNGIKDADPDARAFSRKAYGGFASHFPAQADALLHSLDLSYQKLLYGEASLSNSSSSHSLQSAGLSRPPLNTNSGPSSLPVHPRLKIGSSENLNRLPGIPPRKVGMSSYGARPGTANGTAVPTGMRSNSAIDLQAANRAVRNIRGGYVAPLPPSKKDSNSSDPRSVTSPDHRNSRTRSRTSGSSQSQPGSRSGSPSSRYSYKTYDPSGTPVRHVDSSTLGRPRRLSSSGMATNATPPRGPRSSNTSREPSPNRGGNHSVLSKPARVRSQSGCSEKGTPSRPVLAQKILQQSREAESALSDALTRTRVGGYDDHSDESETSSVCSERSMDSVNRRSDRHFRENWLESPHKDIYDIITACSSTHWSERKEGLMGLQAFLRSGNSVPTHELRKLIEILGKMFTDAHTKVFSLFLDALTVLIEIHKDDMHENLYFLMSRLLNKLGGDLLGSIQAKTLKTLDLVRYCFPYSLQMALLLRFMMDNTQTPNSRVKVALLNYLTALVRDMQPSDLTAVTSQSGSPGLMMGMAGVGASVSPQLVEASVAKVVAWTSDIRSAEVRKASQDALYALFSLHPAEVTRILNTLPKVCQESASQIIQSQLNRTMDNVSLNRASDSPTSVVAGSSPLRSPVTPQSQFQIPNPSSQQPSTPTYFSKISSSRSLENDENEHYNPEEVYKSIRKTTAEIQNYSFEKSSLERDSTSQDSGISQLSHLSFEKNKGEAKPLPLEEKRQKTIPNSLGTDVFMSPMEQADRATMQRILSLFGREDSESRKDAMRMLTQLMHQGAGNLIEDNFRPVFKHLVSCREDPDSLVRRQVFNIWATMLSTPRLLEEMENYADLILVNIFRAQRDQEREVVRSAESCAKTLAAVLSLNKLIRILKHAIGDNYPENYTAIKTLTRLVEQRPHEDTVTILPEMMPALLRATDHTESIVRKAAVFCIVEIYKRAPDELKPYLESLNSSKMKLINVYIQRAGPT